MKTDELIRQLGADMVPVRQNMCTVRLVKGFTAGTLIALGMSLVGVGRIGSAGHANVVAPCLNFLCNLLLAGAALWLTARSVRPDDPRHVPAWPLLLPLALLAGLAGFELAASSGDRWRMLLLAPSWNVCPAIVLLLALPVFAGLCWSFRTFAPTRLRAAGATAGVAAGSVAACIYCIRCWDVSSLFVLTWCTLGIVLAGACGAAVGPKLMRW